MIKIKKKTKKKKNKSKKLAHFVLGFISAILVFLLAYYFVLPLVFSSVKETKNILLVSSNLDERNSKVKLVHLSKNIDDNMIISMDGKEIINIDSYGEYSLNTIYQLLKIDEKSNQEIKSLFSNILGISIDKVVVLNEDNLFKLKLHFLVDSMDVVELKQVEDLKNIYYKLSTLDEITYKNCSVSVVNTTAENGLAKKVSDMIENTGARVMQIEGSSKAVKETTIYYQISKTDKSECEQLVNRVLGIFPTEIQLKDFSELPSTRQFRSNVVVLIGRDY